jgi:glucose 1-dehydrogenase
MVSARRPERLESVEEQLRARGQSESFVCDMGSPDQIDRLVTRTVDVFGRLDALVSAHGILGRRIPFLDVSDGDWDEMLAVNLRGVIRISRASAREMAQTGGGSIVTISSVNAYQASPGLAPYNVSKGALASLTRSMAVDLAGYGIRANGVAPGWTHTPMTAEYLDGYAGQELETNMQGRWAQPREIARTVLFLLSEDSSFMTGETLVVDGGQVSLMTPLRSRAQPLKEGDG